MGFFKKIFNKIVGKDEDLAKKIEAQNELNQKIEIDDKKYEVGLNASSKELSSALNILTAKYRTLDESFFTALEEVLILYDIGYPMTKKVLTEIRTEVKLQGVSDAKLIGEIIVDKMFTLYVNNSTVNTSLKLNPNGPSVFLIVGVNGVGKTTTIAKLAKLYKKLNKKILLVAGDTFRAGAVAQLEVWANRIGVDIFKASGDNSNPASVIFDGVKKGAEEKYDLIICDTAGRLQNKVNLMNELKKINQVIARFIPGAPHESLLVLDATTGQSGLSQAQSFAEATTLTGIILAKMDGTSKGGIVLAIKEAFNLPVKLIGLGEGLDDLQYFDLEKYVDNMAKGLTGISYEKN